MTPSEASTVLNRSASDPAWFVREVLGDHPWRRQVDVLESVRDFRETGVASCHSMGKSFVAARAAAWFLCSHPGSIVITTAPTQRQVRGILWKEIKIAHSRARLPLGGTMLSQSWSFDADWWAWGFTAPEYDPDRFQGFHAPHVLVICDEAAGVSNQIFEAIDSILSGEHCRLLMIGNPTSTDGRFYQSFKSEAKTVNNIRVSAFDTPNFTRYGITVEDIRKDTWEEKITGPLPYPSLITPQWVYDRHRHWGEASPMWESRILAHFPTGGFDALFPMTDIEAATQRINAPESPSILGVDVARYGDDSSVVYLREGSRARLITKVNGASTMELAGIVAAAFRETGAEHAYVDAVGVGGGVVDRLKELGYPVTGINMGNSPDDKEGYDSYRSELFWRLRERFVMGEIDLDPEDEDIVSELSAMRYEYTSKGRCKVESKESMRKRGLSSPDHADALALAFVTRHHYSFNESILNFGRRSSPWRI